MKKILIQKNLKSIFKDYGIQMSKDVIDLLNTDIHRQIVRMAIRCEKGNVKRITQETYHIALGSMSEYAKWANS